MAGAPQIRLIQSLSIEEINKALRDIQTEIMHAVGVSQRTSSAGPGPTLIVSKQAQRPQQLGQDGINTLWFCTDYVHLCRWDGTGWDILDGAGNYVGFFTGIPAGSVWTSATMSGAWKLLDGTGDDGNVIGAAHPITYLKPDGTVGKITSMAALTGNVYPKGGGAFTGVVVAASNPTVAANTTGMTNPANTGSSNAVISNDTDLGATSAAAAGNAYAVRPHTHTDTGHLHSIGAPTDPGHTHTATGGEPANMMLIPYLRK